MTRRLLSLAFILATVISLVYVAHPAPAVNADAAAPLAARSFEFTYQVHFPQTENPGGPVRLWLPLPQPDGYQDVSALHIDSPAAYSQGRDSEYKNRFAMFKPTAKQYATGFDVTVRFTATRREHRVALDDSPKNASSRSEEHTSELQS